MPTFPLTTLGPTISPAGISVPPYADIYQSLQASFQAIFGSDAYIDPDSQDGQMLAIVARAISDCNNSAVALYNAYSPQTAQGNALSNQVKINGMVRNIATPSTVLVQIVGQVGTTITDGVVEDTNAVKWNLPASVVIPPAGFILVTATCQEDGAIGADAGTVTKIVTPTLGWQTVTNPDAASPGAPVESDADLRLRQARSTALPSQTVLAGVVGAIYSLDGVIEVRGYENDTGSPDVNGLPAHSMSMVVLGGNSADIAEAIYLKKTPGTYTHGDVTVPVVDSFGIINQIRFFIPDPVVVMVSITVDALTGYTTAVGNEIKQSVADYINALGIGVGVMVPKLYLPAQLNGGLNSETFDLTSIQIAVSPGPVGPGNITVAFDEIATCVVADINLIVT